MPFDGNMWSILAFGNKEFNNSLTELKNYLSFNLDFLKAFGTTKNSSNSKKKILICVSLQNILPYSPE